MWYVGIYLPTSTDMIVGENLNGLWHAYATEDDIKVTDLYIMPCTMRGLGPSAH